MKAIKNSDFVRFNMQSLESDKYVIEIIFKNNFIKYLLNHKQYGGVTVKELREQFICSNVEDIKTLCLFADIDSSQMQLREFVEANI